MALTQQRGHLLLDRRHRLDRVGLHHDQPHRPRKGVAEDLALRGGQRNDHGIVLIATVEVLPFLAEHADDHERTLADTDRLAERIIIPEQIVGGGLADQRHPRRRAHVRVAERVAADDRPRARVDVGRRRADHRRTPVVCSIDQLLGPLLYRRHVADAVEFGDRLGIGDGQRRTAATTAAQAAGAG